MVDTTTIRLTLDASEFRKLDDAMRETLTVVCVELRDEVVKLRREVADAHFALARIADQDESGAPKLSHHEARTIARDALPVRAVRP